MSLERTAAVGRPAPTAQPQIIFGDERAARNELTDEHYFWRLSLSRQIAGAPELNSTDKQRFCRRYVAYDKIQDKPRDNCLYERSWLCVRI